MKRPIRNTNKPIKRRKTESSSRVTKLLLTQRGYGREPDLSVNPTDLERGKALSWYSGTCGADDARKFLTEYLELLGRSGEVARLAKLPDAWLPKSAAWLTRLIVRGVTLPDNSLRLIEKEIASALARSDSIQKKKVSPEIIERREIGNLIGDIEDWIDHPDGSNLFEWLSKRGVKKTLAPAIITYYGPWTLELMEAQLGEDPQLKEAYRYLSKKKLAARAAWFQQLLADVERYAATPRRRKSI